MKPRVFCLLALIFVLFVQSCHKDTQIDEDLDIIKAYLDEHGINAQKKQSVYYVILEEGTGAQCKAGDYVACKYRLTTISNPDVVVDATDRIAYETCLPSQVPDGSGNDIPGFQIALTLLKEGGKGIFYIPSSLGYGQYPFGPSKESYCNLIYEIELCEILSNGNKH